MNEDILTYNTPSSEEKLKQINQYEFKRLWEKNLKKIIKIYFGELHLL
jgi:hypothetical protein